MLVSHRKKFIFTKTYKTAGTSVESYFEPYCLPEGEWTETHAREEYISPTGIIGFRGLNKGSSTYYNHMPAERIRELVGSAIWDEYFKFTVVRNPFDKMVSAFYMQERNKRNYSVPQRLKALMRRVLNRGRPIDRITGKTDVEKFRSWIAIKPPETDRDKYTIQGKACVDFFIRYEALQDGVREVCERLNIPFQSERIPHFKAGLRPKGRPIAEFYDQATEKKIRKTFDFEFSQFGYEMPKQ